MKKTVLMKGIERTVIEPIGNDLFEITSDCYLTAYKTYGCRTVRTVTFKTADDIYNRLIRKGFMAV